MKRLKASPTHDVIAQALAKSLTKKILHDPISVLKENASSDQTDYAKTTSKLFRLGS